MAIWLVIVIAIGCCSFGVTIGIFLSAIGVVTREKKAVYDGYIEIDGKTYLLGEIIKKGDLTDEKT